jgi:hypothetical protein
LRVASRRTACFYLSLGFLTRTGDGKLSRLSQRLRGFVRRLSRGRGLRRHARTGGAPNVRRGRRVPPVPHGCLPRRCGPVHDEDAVGAKHGRERWAITIVVRFCIRPSSAFCTSVSLSASSADVASSSSRIGASRRMARAMAMRWRWPPESVMPRSPTGVVVAVGSA